MPKDYYQILGLSANASIDEIKHKFRQLALLYHPDINSSPEAAEKFIEINQAYENLMDKLLAEQSAETIIEHNFDREWEEVLNEIRKVAKETARRAKEMREEKARKQKEDFEKSGIYDISLVLRYMVHFLAIFFGIGLIAFPLVISITKDIAALGYLFYFWLIGVFLLVYIYSQLKPGFSL